jgi:hypothetical protein
VSENYKPLTQRREVAKDSLEKTRKEKAKSARQSRFDGFLSKS